MSETQTPVIKYPNPDEVRESLTDEALAELVKALPSYQKDPVTLASLDAVELSPEVLHAWAALCKAFRSQYAGTDTVLTFGVKDVKRNRTEAEIEKSAIAEECSRRYYAEREAAGLPKFG